MGARRYEDMLTGRYDIAFGQKAMIGRTGPSSTNTFRPLNFVIAVRM